MIDKENYCMAEIGFDSEKINRFFKGEHFEKDASYINEVFCDSDKEKELKCLLSRQFNELLPEEDLDNKDLDHILYRIHFDINNRLSEPKIWSFDNIIKWTLRLAGIIILPLVILLGLQTYKESSLKKQTWVEIKAPAWTRAQFSLPDGTIGWLNSNSSVQYNGNFNLNRQVILKGEAFFDVFKDKGRPFVVNINEVSVEVLGTRFNIEAYEDERNIEVVLEEGSLVFNANKMNKTY